jgi:hypothetical protein
MSDKCTYTYLIFRFEHELKRKLSQRAKHTSSEYNLLLNSFKFYDMGSTGQVSKDQWLKTFNKIGLSGFSDKDLAFLFDVYDINQRGVLDYKSFVDSLYGQNTNRATMSMTINNTNVGNSYNNINNNNYQGQGQVG